MTVSADDIQYMRAASSSGCFFSAATTATTPTSASASLTGFSTLGYVSVDGLKMKVGNEEVSLEDWTGDEVLRYVSKQTVEFTLTPLCFTDENALKERFGASNVTVSGGVVTGFTVEQVDLPNKQYVFDMATRQGGKCRIVVPNGKLGGDAEYNFDPKNPTAAEWTIAAFPDSSQVKAYVYFAAPASS